MRFFKKPWFIGVVLLIVVAIGVQYYIKAKGAESVTRSAEEIRAEIEAVYDGELLAFEIQGNAFQATIAKDGAEYALEGDAETGNVRSLIQTKETTVTDGSDSKEDEPGEHKNKDEPKKDQEIEQPKEKKPSRITEKEAAQIGLDELPDGMVGEVDDIDFEPSDQGGFYLVEIDIDTDGEYDEVTYQIHALTGEIITTTWDD